MFILDTDHVSLFQRSHPGVSTRVLLTPPRQLAVAVITVEEQLRGRLDGVRRARSDEEIVRAYDNLQATLDYFRTVSIIGFDTKAQSVFRHMRAQGIRVGTQDLRIAATTLARNATLVTRNRQDFVSIPGLDIEDWTVAG